MLGRIKTTSVSPLSEASFHRRSQAHAPLPLASSLPPPGWLPATPRAPAAWTSEHRDATRCSTAASAVVVPASSVVSDDRAIEVMPALHAKSQVRPMPSGEWYLMAPAGPASLGLQVVRLAARGEAAWLPRSRRARIRSSRVPRSPSWSTVAVPMTPARDTFRRWPRSEPRASQPAPRSLPCKRLQRRVSARYGRRTSKPLSARSPKESASIQVGLRSRTPCAATRPSLTRRSMPRRLLRPRGHEREPAHEPDAI
jgi:hypothetical protein